MIFKVEDIPSAFNIEARYRIKKSGSGPVGKKNVEDIQKFVVKQYSVNGVSSKGAKLFVQSDERIDKEKFSFKGHEYMMSDRGGRYEVRKLSKTHNANVIFSVKLRRDICGMNEKDFISFLVD